MELSIVLFFFMLLIPGLLMILNVRREFKRQEWLDEQRRLEHERNAVRSAGRRPPRSSAPDDYARSSGEAGTAPAGQGLAVSSHLGAALEHYLRAKPLPVAEVKQSHIDEAFEKFMEGR
jgi:hypothetical protein